MLVTGEGKCMQQYLANVMLTLANMYIYIYTHCKSILNDQYIHLSMI